MDLVAARRLSGSFHFDRFVDPFRRTFRQGTVRDRMAYRLAFYVRAADQPMPRGLLGAV
jgi:hypothetical protein